MIDKMQSARATIQLRDDHISSLVPDLIALQNREHHYIEQEDELKHKIKKLQDQHSTARQELGAEKTKLLRAEKDAQDSRQQLNTLKRSRDEDLQTAFERGLELGRERMKEEAKKNKKKK